MCANPVLPAVANAIFNAVGVRIDELPITPEKVLRALKARGGATAGAPAVSTAWRCAIPSSASAVRASSRRRLRAAYYLADEELSTAAYLALALGKPLLLEGAPGVGKTEAAKAIAGVLGRALLRLQCYEGIDAAAALYEWNFPRQMLALRRQSEGAGGNVDIYSDEFLIERPMLACLRRPRRDHAADRRNRPLRSGVRSLPAGVSFRLPDFDSGTRRDPRLRAAGRDPHLQPDARTARGVAPPLRLSLDRISDAGARDAHHHDARLRRQRARGARRRRRGRASAARAAREASRHRRSGRMGRSRDAAQRARRALAGCLPPLARRRAQGRGRLSCIWRRGSTRYSPRRRHDRHGATDRSTFSASPLCCGARASLSRPSRSMAWLSAIELLGPREIGDIRRSAHATLAPPPERFAEFDALFDAHFLGSIVPGLEGEPSDEEPLQAAEDSAGRSRADLRRETRRVGRTSDDRRDGLPPAASEPAARTRRCAVSLARCRRACRNGAATAGVPRAAAPSTDARRMFREAMRNAGEIISLRHRRRRLRQRRVVVLIDVSGSMKERTQAHLAFAHALVRAAELGRGLHHRHAAHPHHPAAAPTQSRTSARHRFAARRRLGWRHAHRRCARRLSRGAAVRGAVARRSSGRAVGRA